MSGCSGGSCSTCSSCDAEQDPDRLPPGMLRNYNINESTSDGVLVWVELDRSDDGYRPSDVSSELIAAARSLDAGRVFGVVFSDGDLKPCYPCIFGCGVDTLYHVRGAGTYMPEAYCESMKALVDRIDPAIVLMGATARGREVAPRLASMIGTGLTADCTGLRMDGRKLIMIRPAFGGNITADIECVRFPQMATVRPGTFPLPEEREGNGTVIYWQSKVCTLKDIVSEETVQDADGNDIRDSRVLISLGGGIRDRSSIDVAERVASKIGASVSCSRSLVERGWMPASRQVGMSGRNVSPDLYLAFGISGAVQHRVGMESARRVVAVNSDPDAPIHDFSDLSIIADAEEVLREMERSLG